MSSSCGAGSIVWRKWGSGPPVIMCHGGSGSWTHWIKTIPVQSRTHTLWLPDLPGHLTPVWEHLQSRIH